MAGGAHRVKRIETKIGMPGLLTLGRLALAAPRRIVTGALLTMVAAGIFGAPVADQLSNGGFRDAAAESSQATAILAEKFAVGGAQFVAEVRDGAGITSPAARLAGTEISRRIAGLPYVTMLQSAWTAPPQAASELVSRDGKAGLVVASIAGDENTVQRHASEIMSLLPKSFDGVTVKLGGDSTSMVQVVAQSKKDLSVMEAVAFPLSFLILVWVFGGVLAAALPLVVGLFAIIGSMAVLRVIAFGTDVSVFAMNLVLAMGLALAIDYTLLIVSRFRDELAHGADSDTALLRTMATAGRTVVFSAATVAMAMITMVFFPIYFLKSFAYAGVAVVALSAVASLLVTPAALVLIGPRRLNALDIRRALRRMMGQPEPQPRGIYRTYWYRWAKYVMRHAIPVIMVVTAFLVALGGPFLGIKWGFADDRLLPPSASSRLVGDDMRSEFNINSVNDTLVVIPDSTGIEPADLEGYAARLSKVPGVLAVSSPTGSFVDGYRAGAPTAATGMTNGSAYLTVNSSAPLYSAASETQLDHLHAVPTPDNVTVQFSGWPQLSRDSAQAVSAPMPLVLAVIGVVTFAVIFLFTGSIVLPLVALVLTVLSLSAAFGALVWVFQDGHLAGLGTTATGTLAASVPMLLFCMAFSLSMDYQLFVLGRIREYWSDSDKSRAASDEAVASGLAHTGWIVTAAAMLMAVAWGSMATAQVSMLRIFAVGLPLVVLVDAVLVRTMLLPAVMHLLGRVSWWAPAPFTWLHQRIGISDVAREPIVPALPAAATGSF